jgi:hypothetical protein
MPYHRTKRSDTAEDKMSRALRTIMRLALVILFGALGALGWVIFKL